MGFITFPRGNLPGRSGIGVRTRVFPYNGVLPINLQLRTMSALMQTDPLDMDVLKATIAQLFLSP